MEDLTTEPASEVNREEGGEETVIMPMAKPEEARSDYSRRIDSDNLEFSAALQSAGSRPEVLAEPQRPVSGSAVHETAERAHEEAGEEATKSLTEIANEKLMREHEEDRPLDYP